MGKTNPSREGSSCIQKILHMKAMAEKSLCPIIWLENGCVGKQFWKEGRVLCEGRTAETCVRAVVTIKLWAGFHLLSFEPKQIPPLKCS